MRRSTKPAPVKRVLTALAALALIALMAAGCGGGGSSSGEADDTAAVKPGGVLTAALAAEPKELLPTVAIGGPEAQILSQILDTLFRTDAEGGTEPWLVTDYSKSADNLTWTLQLKGGVRFSDGKPLTAEDVVFSLDAVRKSVNWETLFAEITKVSAPSKDTVVITTEKPAPALPSQLSLYAAGIVPANYGGVSEEQFAQHPIGSGAFALGPWKRGESITLVPNPHFWKSGQPALEKVIFKNVPEDTARDSQLEGGQLDLITYPNWAQLSNLSSNPDLRVGVYESGFTNSLVFNVRTPLFQNAKVRKAVNLAIDRDSIAKVALGGYGEVAGSWFGPAILYHDASIKPPAQDVSEAKDLLASAVKQGADPNFSLLVESGNSQEGLAGQIIQQNLEEVGFKVAIEPLDGTTQLERLATGKYEASLIKYSTDIGDPSESASFYTTYEGFFAGADVSAVTDLSAEAATEVNPEKRRHLYYEIQEAINEEENLLPLNYQPYTWGMTADLAGFSVNASNVISLATTGFAE
ncbi:MAG TPA: ABC transporter substrate-binding protein [Solirubrobacterales bacterium]|nr:ABC transporter substrate-binding protein [Solirubrobacterales bacterium]